MHYLLKALTGDIFRNIGQSDGDCIYGNESGRYIDIYVCGPRGIVILFFRFSKEGSLDSNFLIIGVEGWGRVYREVYSWTRKNCFALLYNDVVFQNFTISLEIMQNNGKFEKNYDFLSLNDGFST